MKRRLRNQKRKPERGERLYTTERCALTGHIVQEFCTAAIQRSSRRRVEGMREYFDAFMTPEVRSSVPAEEILSRLSLESRIDPQARLREVTTRARELAWEMATEVLPGESLPRNDHLLMPTIINEGTGRYKLPDVRAKSIELQRIKTYLDRPIVDFFRPKYQPEIDRLRAKLLEGGLSAADHTQYRLLCLWIESVSGEYKGLQVGDVFCGYRLEHPLRMTEYRSIFRARSISSQDVVVIKALTPSGAALKRERDAFEKSAWPHANLRHPNIPQIVMPFNESFGVAFYAVKYVEGTPLSEIVECERPAAIRYLLGIAQLLSHLHESGIAHGDLSPSNVIIEPNGDPAFIDFECCAPIFTSGLSQMFVRATHQYLSPERRIDPFRLLPCDDIFAFGVMACELLVGGQVQRELVLSTLRAATGTRALAEVLARCLSDQSGGRYNDGNELTSALRAAVLASVNTGGRPQVQSYSAKRSYSGEFIENRDFSHQDLRGCDFSDAVLVNCDFSNSLLTNATFQRVRCTKVSFRAAFIILARFQNARFFEEVDFHSANLERTVWDGAEILSCVDFSWTNFWGAFISGLGGLERSKLDFANFSRNELSDDQKQLVASGFAKLFFAGNYPDLAAQWSLAGRTELVWWLVDSQKPGGPLTLY